MTLESVMAALLITYSVVMIGGAIAYHLIVNHKKKRR